MRKSKFKVGDVVKLSAKHVEWLISWIPEGHSINGKYNGGTEMESFALFAAREFNEPLVGIIEKRFDGNPPCLPYVFGSFYNQYGVYKSYVDEKDLVLVEPNRKGNKVRK